jgi:hypothetical protein
MWDDQQPYAQAGIITLAKRTKISLQVAAQYSLFIPANP